MKDDQLACNKHPQIKWIIFGYRDGKLRSTTFIGMKSVQIWVVDQYLMQSSWEKELDMRLWSNQNMFQLNDKSSRDNSISLFEWKIDIHLKCKQFWLAFVSIFSCSHFPGRTLNACYEHKINVLLIKEK